MRKILRPAYLANVLILSGACLGSLLAAAEPGEAELLRLLSPPLPEASEEAPVYATRGIGTRVRPDPNTNLCEPASPGGSPQAPARRSLYVEDAPSVDLHIGFTHGAATLTPDSRRTLDTLGKVLQSPELARERFIIAGHTNKVGQSDFNRQLSCARALAVRNYLRDSHGIARERLITMGFGFDRLKTPEQPESDENRRVEIRKSGS